MTLETETGGDRDIAAFEAMGTYSLSDSSYTITVEVFTVTEGESSDFEEDVDAGPELGDTETGTWSNSGKYPHTHRRQWLGLGLEKEMKFG